MGADEATGLMNQLFWYAAVISAPVLIAVLIVGLLVSVFQVATQLQEMTLSYVPKLLAAAVVLVTVGPWMVHKVAEFAVTMIRLIPSLAN
ncbi:flagellar biosynthetic protein FliQ [Asticcacaulis solisilvae]|uniref:flagellar biosynthetic protein FliQ n=1 Tax=Asticcacaulis solisilvae TaxID=1217274 RepID=UPI003FD77177